MLPVVINLQLDSIPFFARHLITGRYESVKVKRLMIELVLKKTATILLPFPQQGTGSNRQLISRGADDRLYVYPIGMATEIGLTAIVRAVTLQGRHKVDLFQAELLAIIWIRELALRRITNKRADRVIKESAILHKLHRAQVILKTSVLALHGKVHGATFIGPHGWIKFVDSIVKLLIVFAECGSRDINIGYVVRIDREMNFLKRLCSGILDYLFSPHHNVARFRIDINRVFNATYTRLRHLFVLLVSFLVIGLPSLQCLRSDNAVDNRRVVPDPSTGGSKR